MAPNKFNYPNTPMKTTTHLSHILLISIVSLSLPSLYATKHKGEEYVCLHTLQGHTDEVNGVTFSPGGKILVSASDDKSLKVWDTSSGKCLRTLHEHSNRVWSVAFSPDGKTLASSSYKEMRVWDTTNGTCLLRMTGHTSDINSIAFAPDGKESDLLISGYCKKYVNKLWIPNVLLNLISKYVLHQGRTLASGSSDKSLKIWDTSTGQCLYTLQGHTDWIWSIYYAQDGQTLASASSDTTIKIWRIKH